MTNNAVVIHAAADRADGTTITTIASTLAFGLALFFSASPALAQIGWLNPEDGDIVNVSTAHVPEPGTTTGRVVRSLESSDRNGQILYRGFRVEYGLRSNLSIGVSGRHMEQQLGDEFKRGLGDSNVFAKLRIPITSRKSSLSFALRQSLTLPTGFEAERSDLATFTSRQNDYTAALSGSFRSRGIALHISPGVILPGGDAPSFLSFGSAVELNNVLPFGFDIAGEYFTRWNMVDEKFQSDVSLEAERALFWNLGFTVGVKRRLLESQTIDPEVRLGLTFGRSNSQPRGPFPRQQRDAIPVQLRIDPIRSLAPDPFGLLRLLDSSFANQGPRYAEGVSVFVHSPRTSAVSGPTGDPEYRLQMRLLDFSEGQVDGLKIPKLWKAPRAETRLFVEAILYGRDDLPLSRPVVIEAKVSQGLGAELIPMTTRVRQMIIPDEVRYELREQVVEKMAKIILEQTTQVIADRVEDERRQRKAARDSFSEARTRSESIAETEPEPETELGSEPETTSAEESTSMLMSETATGSEPETTLTSDSASRLNTGQDAPGAPLSPLPEENDAP